MYKTKNSNSFRHVHLHVIRVYQEAHLFVPVFLVPGVIVLQSDVYHATVLLDLLIRMGLIHR